MNENAEKLIRAIFEVYNKPASWADALISDWEYYFNWAGISSRGDKQVESFIELCLLDIREGRPMGIDPPKSRPIGE